MGKHHIARVVALLWRITCEETWPLSTEPSHVPLRALPVAVENTPVILMSLGMY